MNHKICSRCGYDKPVSEFYERPDRKSGIRSACKECGTQRQPYYNRRMVLSRHNLTEEEYVELLELQNFVCAICKKPEFGTHRGRLISLSIDHCHECNKRRALLCGDCNRAIGLMGEDPERLMRAAMYVASHEHEVDS